MKLQRIIMLGMSGEDVKFIQLKLKEFNFYNGHINSNYGQDTLVSVTNFQRKVGIRANGIIEMATWSHITNYNPNPIILVDEIQEVRNTIVNTIPNKASYIGEDGFIIYDNILSDDNYINTEVRKETIWLHHSEGGSRPDWTIGSWDNKVIKDKKDKVKEVLKTGTNFVIGRKSSSTDDDDSIWDGKILKAFDDRYWSYHLDITSKNSIDLNSKSVSIELCNYGHLSLRDGKFYNLVNRQVNESEVVQLSKPFKGFEYWERYTDNQIESLRGLILYLSNRWGIEIEKGIYNEEWFNYDKVWLTNGGLRSNSQIGENNYDLFPQIELIQMLNSL